MVLGILIEAWLANENHFVKFSATRHRLEKIFDNVLSRDISVQKKSMHVKHIDGVLLPFQISKQLPLRMHHFAFHLKFLLSLNEFTTLIFPQILCKIHFNSVFVEPCRIYYYILPSYSETLILNFSSTAVLSKC